MRTDSLRQKSPFTQTLPGVLLVVMLYTLTHATTRLLASGNLGEDDPFDTLLVQQFAAGYSVDHGPLYDWILWGVQQWLGPTLAAFLTIKYTLLTGTAGLIYLVTRRLTNSPLWGFIAVESMASVYQIFWRLHEGFTHRVLTLFLVMATLWVTIRLIDRRTLPTTVTLGILIGLGVLAEHTYLFFLISLLLGIASMPVVRREFIVNAGVIALPVAAMVAFPYAQWLASTPNGLTGFIHALLPPLPNHHASLIGSSLYDALSYPILVLSPYIVIVPFVFPAVLKRGTGTETDQATAIAKSLLNRTLAIELIGIIFLGGILWAYPNYAVHLLLPMMIIAIPWLTARIHASQPTDRQVRRFMAILLAFTIVAYAMRSGNLFVWEPFCSRCRWGTPYAELATQLREQGFENGLIVTNDIHTAGNLRRFFPNARIQQTGQPKPISAPPAPHTQQLLLWHFDSDQDTSPPGFTNVTAPGSVAKMVELTIPWRAPLKAPGHRQSRWQATIQTR